MPVRRGILRELFCALAMLAPNLACADEATVSAEAPVQDAVVFLQPLGSTEEFADVPWAEELPPGTLPEGEFSSGWVAEDYFWQMLPTGIIYHSYMAGPQEPRISITPFFSSNHSLWDTTIGGRGGIVRYGNNDLLHPQGWQLDAYGAAIARLDSESHQDMVATDYVFGFPLTYGYGNWQAKFGYAHVSSHLGDEYALKNPGSLERRVNYVRDSLVLGTSSYPYPGCRVYGEIGWAFHASGGAEPFEFQFGNELSRPGPTGFSGSPFLAVNGRLREELNYGGDLTAQTGWLWRGIAGQTVRVGAHYYTGKSSQYQFYDQSEQQIGLGLWYDF